MRLSEASRRQIYRVQSGFDEHHPRELCSYDAEVLLSILTSERASCDDNDIEQGRNRPKVVSDISASTICPQKTAIHNNM